jgi:hypothetical protein
MMVVQVHRPLARDEGGLSVLPRICREAKTQRAPQPAKSAAAAACAADHL